MTYHTVNVFNDRPSSLDRHHSSCPLNDAVNTSHVKGLPFVSQLRFVADNFIGSGRAIGAMCVSACPGGYPWNHTRDLYTNFSVHVAYGRGSVIFRQGDEIPRGRGSFNFFRVFSSPMTTHCTA